MRSSGSDEPGGRERALGAARAAGRLLRRRLGAQGRTTTSSPATSTRRSAPPRRSATTGCSGGDGHDQPGHVHARHERAAARWFGRGRASGRAGAVRHVLRRRSLINNPCAVDTFDGHGGIHTLRHGSRPLRHRLGRTRDRRRATPRRLTSAALRRRIARTLPDALESPPPPCRDAIDDIIALLDGESRRPRNGGARHGGTSPEFNRRVYEVARAGPPGGTITYGEIAQRIGEPGAAQAVGRALGRNPFPIVVPCHRVLAAGGALGGFSAARRRRYEAAHARDRRGGHADAVRLSGTWAERPSVSGL